MKTNRVKIKKINHNLVDVFHGEMGWSKWTHLLVQRGELKYVRGVVLDAADIKTVRAELEL